MRPVTAFAFALATITTGCLISANCQGQLSISAETLAEYLHFPQPATAQQQTPREQPLRVHCIKCTLVAKKVKRCCYRFLTPFSPAAGVE